MTSEAELARLLEDGLRVAGVAFYHTHDSRRSAEGFPDYVIRVRPPIIAELKRDGGELSVEQERWISELDQPGIVDAIVVVGADGVMALLHDAIARAGRTRNDPPAGRVVRVLGTGRLRYAGDGAAASSDRRRAAAVRAASRGR